MTDRIDPTVTFPRSMLFPAADVSPERLETALWVQDQIVCGGQPEQIQRYRALVKDEIGAWSQLPGQAVNLQAAHSVISLWGGEFFPDSPRGKKIAKIGFSTTLGYLNRSALLPVGFTDLRRDLGKAAQCNVPAINSISDEAWSAMEREYRRVHFALDTFVDRTADSFGIRRETTDPSYRLLRASSALPYLMSVVSELNRYTSQDLRLG